MFSCASQECSKHNRSARYARLALLLSYHLARCWRCTCYNLTACIESLLVSTVTLVFVFAAFTSVATSPLSFPSHSPLIHVKPMAANITVRSTPDAWHWANEVIRLVSTNMFVQQQVFENLDALHFSSSEATQKPHSSSLLHISIAQYSSRHSEQVSANAHGRREPLADDYATMRPVDTLAKTPCQCQNRSGGQQPAKLTPLLAKISSSLWSVAEDANKQPGHATATAVMQRGTC